MIVLDPSLVKTKNNLEMAEKAREVQRKGISKEEKRLQDLTSRFSQLVVFYRHFLPLTVYVDLLCCSGST